MQKTKYLQISTTVLRWTGDDWFILFCHFSWSHKSHNSFSNLPMCHSDAWLYLVWNSQLLSNEHLCFFRFRGDLQSVPFEVSRSTTPTPTYPLTRPPIVGTRRNATTSEVAGDYWVLIFLVSVFDLVATQLEVCMLFCLPARRPGTGSATAYNAECWHQ